MKYVMTMYIVEQRDRGEWYPIMNTGCNSRMEALDELYKYLGLMHHPNRRHYRVGVYECTRLSKP